jgi:hypothetical protein
MISHHETRSGIRENVISVRVFCINIDNKADLSRTSNPALQMTSHQETRSGIRENVISVNLDGPFGVNIGGGMSFEARDR